MTLAFLFPGQGMEAPSMGLDVARSHAPSHSLLERAGRLAGTDVFRLLARGGRALDRTEVLQPLLTAVCLGAVGELAELGVAPDFVAGHSVGEIAALSAAGCLSAEEAVDLAAVRGRLMARQAERAPGGMLALLVGETEVELALALGRRQGVVDLAAHNAPAEWVLAGDRIALGAVAAAFPSRMLRVSGPWHCRTMAGAVEELRSATRSAVGGAPAARFICNRTGAEPPIADIPDVVAEQLTHPVKWAAAMATLVAEGVTDFVTIGPGRVLRGLVRKNLGASVRVHAAERHEDLHRIRGICSS